MLPVLAFLQSQLENPENQWSLGTFGAIAEFMRDANEQVRISHTATSVEAATERGAIRFDQLTGARLIALESTSRQSWSHSVALCLPKDMCAMGRREVLTELGPDVRAIQPEDRQAILFDLGLRAPQVDVCVRTADPDLIVVLRSELGRSVFDPTGRAMAAILKHSPHRVFIARVGRIEVFQPIPPPDGRSPEGPHTHVLPRLLHKRLTHAATEPIPDEWTPCAYVYPPHPLKDALGRPRPFDAQSHNAFQALLHAYGDPELVDIKTRAIAALRVGDDPYSLSAPGSRFSRNALRVAILQWQSAQRNEHPKWRELRP